MRADWLSIRSIPVLATLCLAFFTPTRVQALSTTPQVETATSLPASRSGDSSDVDATEDGNMRIKGPSGIGDIDTIRGQVETVPTNRQNLGSRRTALHRWWRFLWHRATT
ncbi:MAG: hypothetical protein ABGY41_02015 [Candidatus Poribacteria bacterium]